MAGERDALEAALKRDGGVFLRLAEGMIAQWRVAVGFVEQRLGMAGGCWTESAPGKPGFE